MLLLKYAELVMAAAVFMAAFTIIVPLWRCKIAIIPLKVIVIAYYAMLDKAWFFILQYRWIVNGYGDSIPSSEDLNWSIQEINGLAWDFIVMRILVGFVSYGCQVRRKNDE